MPYPPSRAVKKYRLALIGRRSRPPTFPGDAGHELEALTAYGAYRRSRTLDERPSGQATRKEEAESGEAGSAGLQDWEDEGGAIR
jgi:hypothetical protein